jgi:hypothetical protein
MMLQQQQQAKAASDFDRYLKRENNGRGDDQRCGSPKILPSSPAPAS